MSQFGVLTILAMVSLPPAILVGWWKIADPNERVSASRRVRREAIGPWVYLPRSASISRQAICHRTHTQLVSLLDTV